MKKTIDISPSLRLPLDVMTLATVVYGGRGTGKTTLGAVIAEEVTAARQRFGAIDLKGDWWGLKSTADGRSPAIPVIVFGGDHADVPLEEDAGAFIGETVAGMDQSFILDLEHLSKGKQTKFLGAFFTALYHHNRDPLLMFLDEAQRYAPQKTWDPESAKCLGAVEDLVKLGRKHGIGLVVITQRGAGLNKEISELCDMLVACRTPGPIDQERVSDWLDANATKEQRESVMSQLSGLATGTAVFASGHPDLRIFGVYPVRRRETFDSSATPKVGQRRLEPKLMAKPDLDALRTKMAAAIERAKAEDPRVLRARIAELERRVPSKTTVTLPPVEVHVLVPTITPEMWEAFADGCKKLVADFESAVRAYSDAMRRTLERMIAQKKPAPAARPVARLTPPPLTPRQVAERSLPGDRIGGELPLGARKMLEALVRIQKPITRAQLGTLAVMKPSGGTFRNNLSILSTGGYIEKNGDTIELTSSGAIAAPGVEPVSPDELVKMWLGRLPSGARAILEHLVAIYPTWQDRENLAADLRVEPSGGTWRNNLSILSVNGLIEKEGSAVRAGASLFIGGR